MTSTLRDQLLPRSIRPSTLLNTSMADDASRPLHSQAPYSPQPNRSKKHRDIFSLRRCLSRRGSTTTPVAQDKKKKKSRKGSLTAATHPGTVSAQNTAAAFALLEQSPPVQLCRRSSKQLARLKAPPHPRPSPKSILMQWMERECPKDVLPKILAFCGPQTTAKLQQSNRFWRNLVSSEETWRVLCEELYKVGSIPFFLFLSFAFYSAVNICY